MAIRATTILQGTLAVLETILLVPLVTTQNHLRAIEDCKRRAEKHGVRPLSLAPPCFIPTLLTRACATPDISVDKHPPSPIGVFSYLGLIHPCYHTLSPTTQYLTYLLTFDSILHLSLCFTRHRKYPTILPMFLFCLPSHTQYIVPTPTLVVCELTTGAFLTCACARLAPCPWITHLCLACDSKLDEECRSESGSLQSLLLQGSSGSSGK